MAYEIDEKLIRELQQQTNTLLAGAHLLDRFVEERGENKEKSSMASIYKSLYSLLRTIRHLELSEGEDPAVSPEVVDLAEFCEALCREVDSLTKALSVSFGWKIEVRPTLTMADRRLLNQAILNLLTNAFEAAGAGGTVELRYETADGNCRITVRDDGKGLDARSGADNPLLAQPGGVGLGLKAARRAAQLLGGTVMVQYGPKGTLATLAFPLKEPKDGILHGPTVEFSGGLSDALVEFAPLLPLESFFREERE